MQQNSLLARTALCGALLVGALAPLSSFAKPKMGGSHMGFPKMMGKKNIVQTAAGAPQFSTLVAAVKAAGLVATLSDPGPYTVFAPTNAAFAKLPKGTLAKLLKPANRATLAKILTYHVVGGYAPAKAVVKMAPVMTLPTVEGEKLIIARKAGRITLQPMKGARRINIIKTDIFASNGVIHAIDGVLIPPSIMRAMK